MAWDGEKSMGNHPRIGSRMYEYGTASIRLFVFHSWMVLAGSSNVHFQQAGEKLVKEKRRQEEHGMDGRA